MEVVSCSFCDAEETSVLFEGRDYWFELPGLFPVRRCLRCGLIYLSPRPDSDEIAGYYPTAYQPYQGAIEDEPSRLRRWSRCYALSKKVRAVEKQALSGKRRGRGRALDVGCATGDFLAALRERGWQVTGVEKNERAAAYARARLGLEVVTGELETAGFPDRAFDLVTLWHVLEHVHDPVSTLSELARVTRPGGLLVLAVPNPESFEARIFGRYWAGWDIPRHLHLFARRVLRQMLDRTGWVTGETTYMTGRHWLLALSLHHWLRARLPTSRLRRVLLRAVRTLPARFVTFPYFLLVERLKLGSIMVVYARRKYGDEKKEI